MLKEFYRVEVNANGTEQWMDSIYVRNKLVPYDKVRTFTIDDIEEDSAGFVYQPKMVDPNHYAPGHILSYIY